MIRGKELLENRALFFLLRSTGEKPAIFQLRKKRDFESYSNILFPLEDKAKVQAY